MQSEAFVSRTDELQHVSHAQAMHTHEHGQSKLVQKQNIFFTITELTLIKLQIITFSKKIMIM